MNSRPPQKVNSSPASAGAPRKGINWFRFWVQMAIAALIFNIVAGLVTWFFIFPKLHPGM